MTTSCWGGCQGISQPKALNLLTKLPEATLSLILLFPRGQVINFLLTPWRGGGWGLGAEVGGTEDA